MLVQAPVTSCLFEFHEGAEKILRVQKQHGLAVGADFGLAVAKHACSFGLETVAGDHDVVDLVTDVMDAAVRIAIQEISQSANFRPTAPATRFSCSAT